MRKSLGSLVVILFVIPLTTRADDWPMFRGRNRDGLSAETNVPLTWSNDKNIKWKVPLPQGGNSSPVVINDRVYLTCAQDDAGMKRSLYCFDRNTGKQLWLRTVNYDLREKTHETNPYCAASPAADEQVVVVYHGSAGVHCYDHGGSVLWSRDLGKAEQIWGWAASPIIHGNSIYLNCGPGKNSFLVALDKKTGDVIWKKEEANGADDKSAETKSWIGSWCTPQVRTIDGREQLVVAMPRRVSGHDLKTGDELWRCEGTGDLAYTDPVFAPDNALCVYTSGFAGPAIGFKVGGSGNITSQNRLWRVTEKLPQRIGTGVMLNGFLFIPSEPAIQCIDPKTGDVRWTHRLPAQTFWSPTAATKDRIYLTSRKGTTYVIAPNPDKFELLATNELNETTNAAPAISNGQLFLRTFEHLYCIE